MTAINSHAVLPIARECARHEGDLWIVYMGNNEMIGPFGAISVFGSQAPPLWYVAAKPGDAAHSRPATVGECWPQANGPRW